MRSLSSLATEYVAYKVAATDYNGNTLNLAADQVKMAFVADGVKPGVSDWHTASWVSSGVAGLLVGPRGTVIPVGSYDVWIDVVDTAEEPTEPVDVLTIY